MKTKEQQKLEELKKIGWLVIGNRIEDFITIVLWKSTRKAGLKASKNVIKSLYKKNADEIYRGMLVCLEFGTDVYYTGKYLKK